MKLDGHSARLFFAAVMIYAVVRIGTTVPETRAFCFAALFFLGGVCALSMAFTVAEKTALSIAESWRTRTFNPCGMIHVDGRTCALPDGHRSLEHASAWEPDVDHGTPGVEMRMRFDDTGDRVERRYVRAGTKSTARGDLIESASGS